MRAHTPRALTAHHTTGHLVAFFECLESIKRLPMRAHTSPRPHHPTAHTPFHPG